MNVAIRVVLSPFAATYDRPCEGPWRRPSCHPSFSLFYLMRGSEESHNERSYSLRTTVKCGSLRVVNEFLMSLAEVGPRLEIASSCTEKRSNSVGGELRFAAQRPRAGGVCRRTFSPFRSRLAPQRLKYRSRWKQEEPTLARPKGRGSTLDEYLQEAGLEAWAYLVTWALNFVYSGRHGERAERLETSWSSKHDMNAAQTQALAQLK